MENAVSSTTAGLGKAWLQNGCLCLLPPKIYILQIYLTYCPFVISTRLSYPSTPLFVPFCSFTPEPPPSNRQHLSSDACLEDKKKDSMLGFV